MAESSYTFYIWTKIWNLFSVCVYLQGRWFLTHPEPVISKIFLHTPRVTTARCVFVMSEPLTVYCFSVLLEPLTASCLSAHLELPTARCSLYFLSHSVYVSGHSPADVSLFLQGTHSHMFIHRKSLTTRCLSIGTD